MANPTTRTTVTDPSAFDAYCLRHAVEPGDAVTELVDMALGLPADILDYLRGQRISGGAAA